MTRHAPPFSHPLQVITTVMRPKKKHGLTEAEKRHNLELALRLSLMYSKRRPLRPSSSWALNMITGRTATDPDSIPRAPTAHRALVHITTGKFSGNFADLISLANRAIIPTIYDLCHRKLTYYDSDSGSGSTTLTACNVTLRNGTIHLGNGPMEDGPKFSVKGKGVGLEGVEIHGGQVGVWVEPGGDVSLRDCTVRNACTGVWVGCTRNLRGPYPTAEMSALGLKVLGCGKGSAFGIGSAGSATISASELTGGEGCGILMCGDVPGRLLATDVRCWANGGKGVVVHAGNVVLTRCTIMDNEAGSVTVRGEKSKAELVSCTFNTKSIPVSFDGARLDVNDGSWTKVLFR